MERNTLAAVNGVTKANSQIIAAQNTTGNNQSRLINAAAGNIAKTSNQLATATLQARNANMTNTYKHLVNAQKSLTKVELAKTLSSLANAIKAMSAES